MDRLKQCVSGGSGVCLLDTAAAKDYKIGNRTDNDVLDIDNTMLRPKDLCCMLQKTINEPAEGTSDIETEGGEIPDKVKPVSQNGVCGCCLARGRFKPMGQVDTGALTESCADMLQTTFSIKFEQPWDGSVEGANLICDACESRLRDAHTFRQQVIDAQSNFILHNITKLVSVRIERLDISSFMKTMPKYAGSPERDVSDEEMYDGEDFCMNTIPQVEPENFDNEKAVPFNRTEPKITALRNKSTRIKNRKKPAEDSKASKRKEIKIKCDICEMPLRPLYKVVCEHRQTEHGLKAMMELNVISFECDICNKTFSSCTKKVAHVTNNHYKCTKCPKVFRNVYEKEEHARTHLFRCNHCNESFFTKLILKHHQHRVHKYVCKICTKTFNSYSVRDKHLVKVHGAPQYVCSECGKIFDLGTQYRRHQRRDHLMERNFKCTLCDYVCFYRSLLESHMYTHSNVKKFECTFCHKKFSHRKTLRNHVHIHTGVKSQVCKLCGSAFVQRASLKYHLEKHHPTDG